MKIALLSPYPQELLPAFAEGEKAVIYEDIADVSRFTNWVICYGYRKIISAYDIHKFGGCIVNIHLSYLPWNRGANPNYWSWHDHTPKGVTIHQVDAGIDTGPVYRQRLVEMDPEQETLATSYTKLRAAAADLFRWTWPRLTDARMPLRAMPQEPGGSFHLSTDQVFHAPDYSTPVAEIMERGAETQMTARAHDKYDADMAPYFERIFGKGNAA